MKNKIKFIVFLVLLILLLGACSNEVSLRQGDDTAKEPQMSESLDIEAPPEILPTGYDTVEELVAGFFKDYPEDILKRIEYYERAEFKGAFRNYTDYTTAQNSIYVPYYQDKPIVLDDREGYHGIAISPLDMFGQPRIFFKMVQDKTHILISTMSLGAVLDEKTILESKEKGIDWLISQIPNSDSMRGDNRISLKADKTYEKEIAIKAGNFTAVFSEPDKDDYDTRRHVSFVYDDILVSVWAMPEILTDHWFKELDFKKIELSV